MMWWIQLCVELTLFFGGCIAWLVITNIYLDRGNDNAGCIGLLLGVVVPGVLYMAALLLLGVENTILWG